MAGLKIPYINPIRFRPYDNVRGDLINDDMVRVDKMANQTQYYKGVYPLSNYHVDWKVGETIVIQIQSPAPDYVPKDIFFYSSSGVTNLVAQDITPSGWVGDNVYLYSVTPIAEGLFYFITYYDDGVNYISDIIHARGNDYDLVEIEYSDTENRYGGLFYNSSGQSLWSPKAYFTGIQDVGEPRNEYSIYKDNSGEPRKINAEPQDTIQIELTDITRRHVKQLNRIFSCDTILINEQPVENEENIKIENVEKSDAMNVSINLTQSDNDDFVKNY